jgi:hypothetical protein
MSGFSMKDVLVSPSKNSQKFSNVSAALGKLVKPSVFCGAGTYRAVVLQSFLMDGQTAKSYNYELDQDPGASSIRVLACYARIEEIHGHLPNPHLPENLLSDGSTSPEIIQMHDLFIDASGHYGSDLSMATALVPSTLVEVDFLDEKNKRLGSIVKILHPGIDLVLGGGGQILGAMSSFAGGK